jgi:hypothetical protein
MINFKQIPSMLSLQNTMNNTVNPDWIKLDWDWFRASMLEGSEAIEHHGWKWWKAQNKDLPQLQMEIVDIWHFYLSQFLKNAHGNEELASKFIEENYLELSNKPVIFDGKEYFLEKLDLLSKLDLFIGLSAAKRLHVPLLIDLIYSTGMTWKFFFEQYVKKNILNIFRQKNGYKKGTYHKEWFGKEDNVFLIEEASKLDSSAENYVSLLWDALTIVYKNALIAAGK